MRVKCECGREAILSRLGKRKNCRACGANLLTSAKPVELAEVKLKPGRKPKPPRQIKNLRALCKTYPNLCTELAANGAQKARDAIAAMPAAEFRAALPDVAERLAQETLDTVEALSTDQFREALPHLAATLGIGAKQHDEPPVTAEQKANDKAQAK